MPSRTPHQVLGIPPQATPDEIKHAYRALILKWHPDRHEKDKTTATKRFIEINEAYKELTETLDLESNFEEPFVMNNDDAKSQSSSIDRQSSRSSSEFSDDSYGLRRTRSFDSGYNTTPSSSFKESPTSSYFPKSPIYPQTTHYHQPRNHHPERTSPTSAGSPTRYETWRTGSDLPDGFTGQHDTYVYSKPPRLSQPRPRATSIPKPPPPSTLPSYHHNPVQARPAPTGYCPPPLPNAAMPRLSHSVVHPQLASAKDAFGSSAQHDKRHQNHFGQVVAPVLHTSPYDVPLASIGLGQSGEWTYALPLSLEELFTGIHLKLPITRRTLSGRTKTVSLELDIPAGCRKGSRLVCRRVGHELQRGVFQDIAFIIEDKLHDRFVRECDDLFLGVRVPLVEGLRQYGGEIPFVGVDGQALSFYVDFPRQGAMKGRSVVKGGGMPCRHGGRVVGRGDMIVNWEIVPPQPKKTIGVFKRLWKK